MTDTKNDIKNSDGATTGTCDESSNSQQSGVLSKQPIIQLQNNYVIPTGTASSSVSHVISSHIISSSTPVKVGTATVIGTMPSSSLSQNQQTVAQIKSTNGASIIHATSSLPQSLPPPIPQSTPAIPNNDTLTSLTTPSHTHPLPPLETHTQHATSDIDSSASVANQQNSKEDTSNSNKTTTTEESKIPTESTAIPPNQPPKPTPKLITLPNTNLRPLLQAILHLLQTYGPLSLSQLEFNLPSISSFFTTSSPSSSNTLHTISSTIPLSYKATDIKLKPVLDILVAVGVIHKCKPISTSNDDDETINIDEQDSKSLDQLPLTDVLKPKSNTPIEQNSNNHKKDVILYCFGDGTPREVNDTIYPWEIMQQIKETNQEIDDSLERIRLIKKELELSNKVSSNIPNIMNYHSFLSSLSKNNTSMEVSNTSTKLNSPKHESDVENVNNDCLNTTPKEPSIVDTLASAAKLKLSTKDMLKHFVTKYPYLVTDPVYFAAMKNFNVDVGNVNIASIMSSSGDISTQTSVASSVVMNPESSGTVSGGKSHQPRVVTGTTITGAARIRAKGGGRKKKVVVTLEPGAAVPSTTNGVDDTTTSGVTTEAKPKKKRKRTAKNEDGTDGNEDPNAVDGNEKTEKKKRKRTKKKDLQQNDGDNQTEKTIESAKTEVTIEGAGTVSTDGKENDIKSASELVHNALSNTSEVAVKNVAESANKDVIMSSEIDSSAPAEIKAPIASEEMPIKPEQSATSGAEPNQEKAPEQTG